MHSLKSSLSEKEHQIGSLERQMREAKQHAEASLATLASTYELKLTSQKSDYESTLLRHQTFIEELIRDKEDLNRKVENLTGEIAQLEKQFEKRLEAVMQDQEFKFNQRTEVLLHSEKLKRDKFVLDKTKSIKALTIKGLEPEIERLMEKGKKERKEQDEMWEGKLTSALSDAAREQERALSHLRSLLLAEREEALEQERNHAAQRLREQVERGDQIMQEQRERFHSELERQKSSLLDSSQKSHPSAASAAAAEQRIRALKEQHLQDLTLERARFDSQLSLLKSQHEQERLQSSSLLSSQLSQSMKEREREMREKMQEEQREEIDLIISKLTSDHESSLSSLRSSFSSQLSSSQSLLSDLQQQNLQLKLQVEQERDQAQGSVEEMKRELREEKSHTASLQRQLRSAEFSLSSLQAKLEKYEKSESAMRKELEERYAGKMEELERDRDSKQQAFRDERDRGLEASRRAEKQLAERLQFQEAKHAAELESVQLRVKHMIEKKELVIQQLRSELETKEKRMQEIERMMG
jgi:5-azacytidine-induced protein 1